MFPDFLYLLEPQSIMKDVQMAKRANLASQIPMLPNYRTNREGYILIKSVKFHNDFAVGYFSRLKKFPLRNSLGKNFFFFLLYLYCTPVT